MLVAAVAAFSVALSPANQLLEVKWRTHDVDISAGSLVRICPVEIRGEAPACTNHAIPKGASSLRVTVPSGIVRTELVASALWARPAYSSRNSVTLDIWRKGRVSGTGVLANGQVARNVSLRFNGLASDSPAGEIECGVDGPVFVCEVPAVTMDFSLRAKGTVAQYHSNVEASRIRDLQLGTVPFQEGASIIGRVAGPRRTTAREIETFYVIAKPEGHPTATRTPSQMKAAVGRRGFFHLDGVAPGAFKVQAFGPQGLSSRAVSVVVRERSEIEILDELTLSVPARLRLNCDPPTDEGSRQWRATLMENVTVDHSEIVAGGLIARDGAWSSPLLTAGDYDLCVGSQDGRCLFTRNIRVDGESIDLPVNLRRRRVNGSVFLGKRPLAAALEFSSGCLSVAASSDEEGRFEVLLPEHVETPFTVGVQSDTPRVKRRNIPLRLDSDNVTIRLPLTVMTGEVVDPAGRPVSPAMVNIAPEDRREPVIQPNVGRDGTFVVHGLATGTYAVQAESPRGMSKREIVKISGDGTSQSVRLVLEGLVRVEGKVFSDFGPVSGATVILMPTDERVMHVVPVITEADGNFWAEVPQGATQADIQVYARGFAVRIFHVRLGETPLNIKVSSAGSEITVGGTRDGYKPYLVHEGAIVPIHAITSFWEGRALSGSAVVIPMMEPGIYTACLLTDQEFRGPLPTSRCTTAFAPPFGSLTIDLR